MPEGVKQGASDWSFRVFPVPRHRDVVAADVHRDTNTHSDGESNDGQNIDEIHDLPLGCADVEGEQKLVPGHGKCRAGGLPNLHGL